MIGRCIDDGEPFGVVLIRDGREVGADDVRLADVGTTAVIREAERLPDGQMEILTVGGQRFRIHRVERSAASYLVADVTFLEELLGDEHEAHRLAARVGQRFMRYLELLQPALDDDGQPEIEVEIEIETEAGAEPTVLSVGSSVAGDDAPEETTGTDQDRRDLLMSAARRLTASGDPTTLSYLLTGLIQVELPIRQTLLEAPDVVSRLRQLHGILAREMELLGKGLKPLTTGGKLNALRRN